MEEYLHFYDVRNNSFRLKIYEYFGLVFFGILVLLLVYMLIDSVLTHELASIIVFTCSAVLLVPYYIFKLFTFLTEKTRIPHKVCLSETMLYTESVSELRSINLKDVQIMIGYSSISYLAMVLISENSYIVANISTGNVFFKEGKDKIQEFYQIFNYCKDRVPHCENIVKSRRTKAHPWIRVPMMVFEWDLYSKRTEKLIDKIRKYQY